MTTVITVEEYHEALRAGEYGMRMLIEGDSWVSHPFLKDLGNQFERLAPKDALILNLAWPGDDARDVFRLHGQQMRKLEKLLQDESKKRRFDLIFLSAAGNDIVGPEIVERGFVRNKRDFPGLHGRELITPQFFQRLSDVVDGYGRFLDVRDRSKLHKGTPVATHVYCYMQPRKVGTHLGDLHFNEGWIAKHLEHQAIRDPEEQCDVVAGMLDAYWERMMRLAPSYTKFMVVDTRKLLMKDGKVHRDWWKDEIHPRSNSFGRVAQAIVAQARAAGYWPQ